MTNMTHGQILTLLKTSEACEFAKTVVLVGATSKLSWGPLVGLRWINHALRHAVTCNETISPVAEDSFAKFLLDAQRQLRIARNTMEFAHVETSKNCARAKRIRQRSAVTPYGQLLPSSKVRWCRIYCQHYRCNKRRYAWHCAYDDAYRARDMDQHRGNALANYLRWAE